MSEDKLNDRFGAIDPDKDFGLPKVEITPIHIAESKNKPLEVPPEVVEQKRSEDMPLQAAPDTVRHKKTEKVETRRSYGGVGFLLIILAFFFTGWYYFSSQQADPVEPEPEAIPVAESIAPVAPDPEPEIVPEEKLEEYILTEITSRGDRPRYFVVVGSFVDEDMAKDHSDVLNAKGMNTFLVYPYGEIVYYRLDRKSTRLNSSHV